MRSVRQRVCSRWSGSGVGKRIVRVVAAAKRFRGTLRSMRERIAEHAAHLDAATHRLLTDIRTFDEACGWADHGARSCAAWLSWRVGWDVRTANEHVRVANRLGKLPNIDDALRRGEMSFAKVRAMIRVATPQNEEMLLEEARYSTGAQLEKICRQYASVRRHDHEITPKDDEDRRYVVRRDTADGMVKVEAVLHPEEASLVWAAMERVASERCRGKRDAANQGTDQVSSTERRAAESGHSGSAEPANAKEVAQIASDEKKPRSPSRFDRRRRAVLPRRSRSPERAARARPPSSIRLPRRSEISSEPSKSHQSQILRVHLLLRQSESLVQRSPRGRSFASQRF